jgi:2-C-methyl-D-erythritol 4-phosphate cytidylyltransferase
MKLTAIIAAAGKGKRFNNGADKVFLPVNGIPIILMSLRVLLEIDEIDEIIIALNKENFAKAKEYLHFDKVSFIEGGEERVFSVQNAVFKANNDLVLIHDAVRPLIKKSFVEMIINSLDNDSDGVIPVLPVKPTIKENGDDGFVKRTIPRKNLVEAQTPQLFRKSILLKAYMNNFYTVSATDEAMLAENVGGHIKTVAGLEENIKVTTPFDLFIISKIIEQWKLE